MPLSLLLLWSLLLILLFIWYIAILYNMQSYAKLKGLLLTLSEAPSPPPLATCFFYPCFHVAANQAVCLFSPFFPSLSSPSHLSSILLNYHPLVTLIRSITCNYMFLPFPLSPFRVCLNPHFRRPQLHPQKNNSVKFKHYLVEGIFLPSLPIPRDPSGFLLSQVSSILTTTPHHIWRCYNNVQLHFKQTNTALQTDTHTEWLQNYMTNRIHIHKHNHITAFISTHTHTDVLLCKSNVSDRHVIPCDVNLQCEIDNYFYSSAKYFLN